MFIRCGLSWDRVCVGDVGAHAAALGTKAFIVGGGRAIAAIKDTVTGALDEHGIPYHIEHGKHVDKKRPEVDALVAKGKEQGADVVIAAGGGVWWTRLRP